jgi:hypothetical protein
MIASTPSSEMTIPASCPPVAEHDGAGDGDEHGRERIHHRNVQRGGELQPDELQRAEHRPADQREIDQHAEMPADQRPVARKLPADERVEHRRSEQPAQRRDRERRHVAGDRPAHQVIARPAQAAEREQEVGVVVQAPARLCFGHAANAIRATRRRAH